MECGGWTPLCLATTDRIDRINKIKLRLNAGACIPEAGSPALSRCGLGREVGQDGQDEHDGGPPGSGFPNPEANTTAGFANPGVVTGAVTGLRNLWQDALVGWIAHE